MFLLELYYSTGHYKDSNDTNRTHLIGHYTATVQYRTRQTRIAHAHNNHAKRVKKTISYM